ncbi:hypothetical protein MNBD_ALPHA12-346 [hydrothermal vent metagenome]|uniref:Uncharacterized protein n=1 Tax=hydrothermal vent metagenome TaxID=652676 RepID=A0A3B0TH97_9ZZZZ
MVVAAEAAAEAAAVAAAAVHGDKRPEAVVDRGGQMAARHPILRNC